MEVETRAADLSDVLGDGGRLYLTAPQAALRELLQAPTRDAGLPLDEPFPQVMTVDVDERQLGRLTDVWSETLGAGPLQEIRCYLAGAGETPSVADLMRAQSLGSLIAWVNGQWLKEVIDHGRLVTHFQPIVRSRQPDTVFAYECLLRGQDRDGRLITPDRMYSAARGARLLDRLDSEARLTAIESASRFQLSSRVFINFNPRSIDDPHRSLQSTLRATLSSQIATENFVFEVVESDEISDTDSLMDIAEHFRMAGCRIALDDVGAGYNSLNLIAILKPDFIKLDMGLIRNVDRDDYKAHVTSKLLELARDLGVQTVVEGVETESEWQWACEHGADFAQGYLFARPAAQPPQSAFSARFAGAGSTARDRSEEEVQAVATD